jgi:hypothetical protein
VRAGAEGFGPTVDAAELDGLELLPGWDDELSHGDLDGAIPGWRKLAGDEAATVYRAPDDEHGACHYLVTEEGGLWAEPLRSLFGFHADATDAERRAATLVGEANRRALARLPDR